MNDTINVDGQPLTVTKRECVDGINILTVRGLTNERKIPKHPIVKNQRRLTRTAYIAAREAIEIAMGELHGRSSGGHSYGDMQRTWGTEDWHDIIDSDQNTLLAGALAA